jgi:DNA-binding CsgD family transcriptional regulator
MNSVKLGGMTVFDSDIEELIGAIYEGPLESVPWQSFLNLLRNKANAMTTGIILRPPSAGGDKGLLLDDGDTTREWGVAYQDRFFELDPFVDLPTGKPVTLHEVADMDELVQSEFYTQYMEPMGAFYALAMVIREPGGLEARLHAVRSPHDRDFGEEAKTLCLRLAPHLQRALQIHGRLQRIESERNLYVETVDQLAVGTILLDENGHIVQMNQMAQALIDEEDGLFIDNGVLYASDHETHGELQALVTKAIKAQTENQPSVIEALRVRRSSGNGHIGFLVRPAPSTQWSDGKTCPVVALFVTQPDGDRLISSEIVRQLFGFTKAEASVATLLAEGLSVEDVSDKLDISVHTARAHLRALYSKTGVSRQTELVLLILRSAANLGSADPAHTHRQ